MQKFLKRATALSLCLLMLLTGCAQGDGEHADVTLPSDAPAGSGNMADYCTVWSAPSTVKIDRNDTAYANKGEAKLTYNAVKNEYESHQLMITATADISGYYLESSDLKSGENVLSKDNITVYNEKYVTLAEGAYGSFTHPDALVPIDAAMTYGELKIAAGQNGALWVTIYVPAETPAGVYEGTFKLTVNNASMDIPVELTVNDYTLPDTFTGKTLFSWRYDRIGAGEMDSSIEMMETYYEFFLDYGISLQSLPLESQTHEEIVDTLTKYYDMLTTYTIQPEPGEVPGGGTIAEKTKDMILSIASISSPDKNYFDKAMLYVVDEPYLPDAEKREYAMNMIGKVNEMLTACVTAIQNDTSGTYDAFKSIDNWQDSILNIPNVMPLVTESAEYLINGSETEEAIAFMDAINIICPTFDVYNDQLGEKLLALCEKHGVENIWWYGCTRPLAPYGNYHIGDPNLLDARTYSWVQAKYGIKGNLYWDAAAYTDENPLYYNQFIDVYEAPYRGTHESSWPAGDGFLAYPGAAFGVYGPLPSMRLMSIRDGMEELEMLLALKEQYIQLEAQYGEDFSAENSIASLVNAVSYNGSQLYADGESGLDFDATRASLIDSLVWNESGVGFVLESVSVTGDEAEITYYAAEDCEVYINDTLQTSVKGTKYNYTLDLSESTNFVAQIQAADGTEYEVDRFISAPTIILQDFEDAAVLDGITVSEGGTKEISQDYATEGSSLHMQVVGKVTGNALTDAAYVPSFSISTDVLNGVENMSEIGMMKLDVYNSAETEFKFTVKIYSGTSYVNAGTFTLGAGSNTIAIAISNLEFSGMDTADKIAFEFENSTDGVNANQYDFYLDNMIAAE